MNSNFTRAELKAQAKEQLRGNVGSYIIVLLAYIGVCLLVNDVIPKS